MKPALIILLISTIFSLGATKSRILSDEFINQINSNQNSWIAGRNFPEDTPYEYLKRLAGTLKDPNGKKFPLKVHEVPKAIPESFDSRDQWPECQSSINNIRNQGGCGSCWAFAASEVMSDRLCIASNGQQKVKFAPEELITCCYDCGDCNGGWEYNAFEYWFSDGVVSGGDYDSGEGCQPYQEDPFYNGITPACSQECLNRNYGTSYSDDKRYGSDVYSINQNEQQIQTEIMTNGPVDASYIVYEDFYNYQSGVYVYSGGDELGWHAVKIIGWGTENGLPYWLVANSWGDDWANLGGFFKILRGENHCEIEAGIVGATPRV